jgi:hypothetical protein
MIRHPDVHRPWAQWSEDQTLHVAVAYSNPFRWRTRREQMNKLRDHLAQEANVVLHLGELAFGDRPWEVTSAENPLDIQLRTKHEAFYKENIQNVVIERGFPADWKYGMCCDADFQIITVGWALETIHQLQHYDWIQPFSSYVDVTGGVYGQANVPYRVHGSFFFNYIQNGYRVSPQYHSGVVGPDGNFIKQTAPIGDPGYEKAMGERSHIEGEFLRGVGATGGSYAFTHDAFDKVGRILDRCILGHGDWYMAYQLVGLEPPDIHSQNYHPAYKEYVRTWGKWAERIHRNVGYVDAMATHAFHGSKTRRGYSSRDVILAKHQFNPYVDIYADWQGIWQFAPEAWQFRDDTRRYFISRFEDDPNIYLPEKAMI